MNGVASTAAETAIQQAILHPEDEVRCRAVKYFGYRRDTTIMPIVIRATQRLGPHASFNLLRAADDQPQTPASLAWLVEQLGRLGDRNDLEIDNYYCALAVLLSGAEPQLLRREYANLPGFPAELRGPYHERLDMADWDWPTAWQALEELGRDTRHRGEFRRRDLHRGQRIVEVLARHAEHAAELLPLLNRHYDDRREAGLLEWLAPWTIDLAGQIRFRDALPVLLIRLADDDWEISNSAEMALAAIGNADEAAGDELAERIAWRWRHGDPGFRMNAAGVLEYVHTRRAVNVLLELAAGEHDRYVRLALAHALLAQLRPEVVEPVWQMTRDPLGDAAAEVGDVCLGLVAVCEIVGATFPEHELWHARALRTAWGWAGLKHGPFRSHLDESDGPSSIPESAESLRSSAGTSETADNGSPHGLHSGSAGDRRSRRPKRRRQQPAADQRTDNGRSGEVPSRGVGQAEETESLVATIDELYSLLRSR